MSGFQSFSFTNSSTLGAKRLEACRSSELHEVMADFLRNGSLALATYSSFHCWIASLVKIAREMALVDKYLS